MALQLSQAVVEQYVALTHGRITREMIWRELDIGTADGKEHLRKILPRLVEKNILRALPNGGYQRVDGDCPEMNWQDADLSNTVDLVFPFGLEKYAIIYPKSIIIVAGGKNVGKTAMLYNFIVMNMFDQRVDLYNTETGKEQMKRRFSAFPTMPELAPFNTFERYDNFAEVIKPDRISVIDYLDTNSEVYMVGAEIDAIFRKLTSGVAVIAMQKPPPSVTYVKGKKTIIDRDLAYGGGFSSKRAVLYISISDHRLKLVYVKTPKNENIDPNNMQWTFNIGNDGITFKDVKPYQEYSAEQEPWYQ